MENIELEINNFKNAYSLQIKEYMALTNKQFRTIVPRGNVKTFINIVSKGTKMRIRQIEDEKSFISSEFTLYIGYLEILKMYNSREDLNIFECFSKIITHEYMHILLGHLDQDELLNIANFAKGKLKSSYDYECKANPFFVMNNLSERFSRKLSIDPTILNMAGDFQINFLLNIESPFLRAKDFGLPEGLKTEEYYSILYHTIKPESFIKDQSKYLRIYYSSKVEKLKKCYESLKTNNNFWDSDELVQFIDENGDIIIGKINNYFNYSRQDKASKYILDERLKRMPEKSNVESNVFKFEHKETGIWKEFRDIMDKIKSNESIYKLSFVDKTDNWCKFNNRKDNDLIYPGKYEKLGSIERKLMPSSVLFVDVSGSMFTCADPLFTLCYLLIKKLNIKIAFFNDHLVKVFTKTKDFNLENFIGGGNNFEAAFLEYKEKYGSVKNIYILSDGYDPTFKYYQDKAKIWCVNNDRILDYKEGEYL